MTSFREANPRLRWALVLLGYLAITFALYGSALGRGWCCDDTQILRHALEHRPGAYFFHPPSWRALIPFSLTPWLTLAYDVDHTLFGFAARGYYAHQLLAIALAAWLVHLVARGWTSNRYAAAGALIFLLGVPVAQASQTLMVRHYAEGAVAWLAAMWLVQRRLQRPSGRNALAAALVFAIAASAKEVYLPLGLMPLLALRHPWPARLRAMAPLLVVMVLYVPWRTLMLGELLGGYLPRGELAGPGIGGVLTQAAGVPALLFSRPVAVGAALAVVALLAAWPARRVPLKAWLLALLAAAAGGVLLAAPLLPLTAFPGIGPGSERYFFAPWTVFALGCAWLLARASQAAANRAVLSVVLQGVVGLLAAGIALAAWQPAKQSLAPMAANTAEHDAHFVLLTRGDAADVLIVSPRVAAWFVEGALALRPFMGRHEAPPQVVADEMQLADEGFAGKRLWRYDAASGSLIDARAGIAEQMAAWRGRVRTEPLSVRLQYDAEARVLRWQLAPADPARDPARFALVAEGSRLDAPFAAGALRQEQPPPACFRIRRDAADGGIAYSPWLKLAVTPGAAGKVEWHGTSESAPALRVATRCPPG